MKRTKSHQLSFVCITLDGAHSAVRQNLYKSLQGKNVLPKSDTEDLKFTQNAVMGMTNPLDLDMYPAVGARFTECHIVIGKESPYTVRFFNQFSDCQNSQSCCFSPIRAIANLFFKLV